MKLRSGKTYATTCYICKEYYGTDETPICSLCKKGKDGVIYNYHSPVFQEKLIKYAESKMIGKAEQKFLIKISNKGNDNGLLEALKNLKNNYGLRLSAEFAHKLLFKQEQVIHRIACILFVQRLLIGGILQKKISGVGRRCAIMGDLVRLNILLSQFRHRLHLCNQDLAIGKRQKSKLRLSLELSLKLDLD